MKKLALLALALFLLFIIAVAIAPFFLQTPHMLTNAATQARNLHTIYLNGMPLRVFLAQTPSEREQGLGGRATTTPGDGMLFVFPEEDRHAIWMRNMRFAIDVLWISASGEVVDIKKAISPHTFPEIFEPKAAARFILELPAGLADSYNAEIGSVMGF